MGFLDNLADTVVLYPKTTVVIIIFLIATIVLAFIGIIILVVVIVALYKQKQNKDKELKLKNIELEKVKKELKNAIDKLKLADKEKNDLLNIIDKSKTIIETKENLIIKLNKLLKTEEKETKTEIKNFMENIIESVTEKHETDKKEKIIIHEDIKKYLLTRKNINDFTVDMLRNEYTMMTPDTFTNKELEDIINKQKIVKKRIDDINNYLSTINMANYNIKFINNKFNKDNILSNKTIEKIIDDKIKKDIYNILKKNITYFKTLKNLENSYKSFFFSYFDNNGISDKLYAYRKYAINTFNKLKKI